MVQGSQIRSGDSCRRQIVAEARILKKTINLAQDNACGVDDDDSGTPYVDKAEHRVKVLFFVWATLTEHKWVIPGERRGGLTIRSGH